MSKKKKWIIGIVTALVALAGVIAPPPIAAIVNTVGQAVVSTLDQAEPTPSVSE